MKELSFPDDVQLQDIKTQFPTSEELDVWAKKSGSYKLLFNNRSQWLREQGISVKDLTEEEAKKLLPSHYSLLKRPVLWWEEDLVLGNSKDAVQRMKALTEGIG